MTSPDVEKSAAGLLEFMWAERDGSLPLPIDPVQIAKRLGVQVFQADLREQMSGSIVKRPGEDPVILLNRHDSRSRQRFSCAHELGHFIERTRDGREEFEFIEYRGPLAATGLSADEVHANQFAAALLMPENLVREHHQRGERQFELAQRFDVSVDAMGYRLTNLRLER